MKKLGLLAAAAALVVAAGGPAPARSALPNTTTERFLQEALREANLVRARHHAPPLVLDRQLSRYAAARARAASRWEGLRRGAYGGAYPGTAENVYWGASSVPAVRGAGDAVDSWAQEGRGYDFAHPGATSRGTGRFTQLVWRSTRRLGAARVSGRGAHWYETYIVFVFSDPGNVPGQYARNVLPADPVKGAPNPGAPKPNPGTPKPGPGAVRPRPGTSPGPSAVPAPQTAGTSAPAAPTTPARPGTGPRPGPNRTEGSAPAGAGGRQG